MNAPPLDIIDDDLRCDYVSFINRSFRDIADNDYIAARLLYKNRLGFQFLWSASQAIEKYLKAILLYNGRSTKKFSHQLLKLLRETEKLNNIRIDYPEDVSKFIEYLDRQGNNRYFNRYAYTVGDELLKLDKSVWYIRKSCFYPYGKTTPDRHGKRIEMHPAYIEWIKDATVEDSIKYSPINGHLEEVLKQKESTLRKELVSHHSNIDM